MPKSLATYITAQFIAAGHLNVEVKVDLVTDDYHVLTRDDEGEPVAQYHESVEGDLFVFTKWNDEREVVTFPALD